MLRALAVLFALMLSVNSSGAQSPRCLQAAVSTAEMRECQRVALIEVDCRLNASYRRAIAGLEPDQQEKLRRSERAWIAFRDADCDVFYSAQIGTRSFLQAGSCLINHSEQRIRDLASFLD